MSDCGPWEPEAAGPDRARYDKLHEGDVDGIMIGWLFFQLYERVVCWRRARRFARRTAIPSRP